LPIDLADAGSRFLHVGGVVTDVHGLGVSILYFESTIFSLGLGDSTTFSQERRSYSGSGFVGLGNGHAWTDGIFVYGTMLTLPRDTPMQISAFEGFELLV
jgi:hypothetical protein